MNSCALAAVAAASTSACSAVPNFPAGTGTNHQLAHVKLHLRMRPAGSTCVPCRHVIQHKKYVQHVPARTYSNKLYVTKQPGPFSFDVEGCIMLGGLHVCVHNPMYPCMYEGKAALTVGYVVCNRPREEEWVLAHKCHRLRPLPPRKVMHGLTAQVDASFLWLVEARQ